MRKAISPIIYAVLLLPLTAIAVFCEVGARNLGILPSREGLVDSSTFFYMSGIIIVTGIPVFWLANLLFQWFERPLNPNFLDHLRQSSFLYIIILYSTATWLVRGYNGTEEDGYLLLWSGYSLIAVGTNMIYLFYNKNKR